MGYGAWGYVAKWANKVMDHGCGRTKMSLQDWHLVMMYLFLTERVVFLFLSFFPLRVSTLDSAFRLYKLGDLSST